MLLGSLAVVLAFMLLLAGDSDSDAADVALRLVGMVTGQCE